MERAKALGGALSLLARAPSERLQPCPASPRKFSPTGSSPALWQEKQMDELKKANEVLAGKVDQLLDAFPAAKA